MKAALLKFFKGITLLTLVSFILLDIFLMFIVYKVESYDDPAVIVGTVLLLFASMLNLPFAYRYAQSIYRDNVPGKAAKTSYLILIIILRILANGLSVGVTVDYSDKIATVFNGIIPITDRVYKVIDDELSGSNLSDVEHLIEEYGADRLDQDRIGASNFEAMMNLYAVQSSSVGRGNLTSLLNSRLSFGPTNSAFYSDSILISYDDVWGDYVTAETMCGYLYLLIEDDAPMSSEFEKRVEELIGILDPVSARLAKIKGDKFASENDVVEAQKWYSKYIEQCELSGAVVEPEIVVYVNNRYHPSEIQEKLYTRLLDVIPKNSFASLSYMDNDDPTIHLSGKGEVGYCYIDLSLVIFGGDYWSDSEHCYVSMDGAIAIADRVWSCNTYGETKGFEKISGLQILSQPADSSFFPHYNSEFIGWVEQNLVPEPSDFLGRNTFQKMYDVLFKKRVRDLFLAYVYLQGEESRRRSYTEQYRDAIIDGDEYGGLNFVYGSFRDVSVEDEYIAEEIGTLLRRSIDGSYSEVVALLFTILNEYDTQWVRDIKRRYGVSLG